MLLCDDRVNSSAIAAIAYDGEVRQLFVRFASGKVYRYEQVPPGIYTGLAQASSKGNFFGQHVRNTFVSTQLDQPAAQALSLRMQAESAALAVTWCAELAGSAAAQDPLGLFF